MSALIIMLYNSVLILRCYTFIKPCIFAIIWMKMLEFYYVCINDWRPWGVCVRRLLLLQLHVWSVGTDVLGLVRDSLITQDSWKSCLISRISMKLLLQIYNLVLNPPRLFKKQRVIVSFMPYLIADFEPFAQLNCFKISNYCRYLKLYIIYYYYSLT